MSLNRTLKVAAVVAGVAGAAGAQTVLTEEGFDVGEGNGWLANGVPTIFDTGDGNPDKYMGVPYMDFEWVELRHENPADLGLGDLTVHHSVTLSVDVRVFALKNFFEEDMNPDWFPLTLQLVDGGDPDDYNDDCSVYFTAGGLPQIADGWAHFSWTIDDTSLTALPDGWGGTGAEDPVDYHPILPPGRTFASVLAHVTSIHFTTAQPGYFYGSSWWQLGFDNVKVTTSDAACSIADMDANGQIDLVDFFAFFNCFDQSNGCADVDGNPGVDLGDFFAFLNAFDAGC